jgi:hypothetical protein
MSEQEVFYAILAKASYDYGLEKSENKRIKKVTKFLNENGIYDFVIDKKLSNTRRMIIDYNNQRYTIFHGTHVGGKRAIADLTTDLTIPFGGAGGTVKKARKDNTNADVYIGHSLGGYLAAEAATKNNAIAYAFNAPLLKKYGSDVHSYRTKNDPVSMFNKQKTKKIKTFHKIGFTGAHTIDNFTDPNIVVY